MFILHTEHKGVAGKITTHFDHNSVAGKQDYMECHPMPEDNIHATVSGDCVSCHNTVEWSPVTFDHDNYFSLTEDYYVSC